MKEASADSSATACRPKVNFEDYPILLISEEVISFPGPPSLESVAYSHPDLAGQFCIDSLFHPPKAVFNSVS
jgi:hypothetical protein